MQSSTLSALPACETLRSLAATMQSTSLETLFAEDSQRVTRYSLEAAGLHLDYSKHLLNESVLQALLELAEQAELYDGIEALFTGAHVNNTEDRPALHMLLRAASAGGLDAEFEEVVAARALMKQWADQINAGQRTGFSGAAITDVVNIGIGGSDLGPRLVTEALQPFHGAIRCHYVANVDPADLQLTLSGLNPGTTLFIVCSKSFRTEETLTNSLAARAWLINAGASHTDLDKHFLAVTSSLQAAADFGIPSQNCLPMWDWVGGRYSVWSAIGLSCAIAVGWQNFEELLAGAAAMDAHFRHSRGADNMPLLLSLLEVWYSNFHGAGNYVVLPYDNSLKRLPDFLQQLTMESNGKSVGKNGQPVDFTTGIVLWGSAGTIGQHSFHQLLHQGTLLCPVDFVLPLTTHTDMPEQHTRLVANCLAQSRTLMVGRSVDEARAVLLQRGKEAEEAARLAPHLAMPGSRPSSTISMHSLNPSTLGALLALYEHRTFCSGKIWGINSFDQWGVELGKEIGVEILARLNGDSGVGEMDPSTEALMRRWSEARP